ncbi:hypothetical protein MMC09_002329 [Bachmanniomyces sp. S44760]|nr:hypothetical protein [Bachmanniomyces sp. S44760]
MADQLLAQVKEVFEGQIDFEGQKLAELLTTVLLIATGLIALLVGLIMQNIHLTLWTGLAGTAIAFLVVVPPWPAFNKNPENWLRSSNSITGSGIEVDGKKIN